MAEPFPGPYVVREDDLSDRFNVFSTAVAGPLGQGQFLAVFYPVRESWKPPRAEDMAQARATADLFARSADLLKCVEELLPFARVGVDSVNNTLVGNLYPAANLRVIERAEAVVAALRGVK